MNAQQIQGTQVASIESALQDTLNAASEVFKTRNFPTKRALSTPVQSDEAKKARELIKKKPVSPRQAG